MSKFITIVCLIFCIKLPIFAENKEIIILHTNDIESVYEPIPATWRDDMELIGGISHLATLIRNTRKSEDISFLVDDL